MPMSPFAFVGALLASGPGVLFLSALAASIVLVWNWRWALASGTLLMLGVSSTAATLHNTPPLITASQWVAIMVANLLLGLSMHLHPTGIVTRANVNWLLRSLALGFLLGAWWVVDPGVSLPLFSQVETDLLLWAALCGILLLGLSATPFYMGLGLLLLTVPAQSIAPVLLPGSGLSILVGIAQILVALGCAYLTLAQPASATSQRRVVMPAPQPTALQPTALQPTALQPTAPQPAMSQPSVEQPQLLAKLAFRRPALFAAKAAPVAAAPPAPQPEAQAAPEAQAESQTPAEERP